MKIKAPDIPENLPVVTNFQGLLAKIKYKEYDIASLMIRDEVIENYDFTAETFRNIAIENCTFSNCTFYKCSFINTKISRCDFSNSDFSQSYWKYCTLEDTKALGSDCKESTWNQVTMRDVALNYSSFHGSKWQNILLAACPCQGADLSEMSIKDLELDECDLTNAVFFKTPLKGIDFSNSKVKALVLSDDHRELKGATFSLYQAVELALLLEINIKD